MISNRFLFPSFAALLLALLALAGCGSPDPVTDSGDAGTVADRPNTSDDRVLVITDAGTVMDASTLVDAAIPPVDTGTPEVDSGLAFCAVGRAPNPPSYRCRPYVSPTMSNPLGTFVAWQSVCESGLVTTVNSEGTAASTPSPCFAIDGVRYIGINFAGMTAWHPSYNGDYICDTEECVQYRGPTEPTISFRCTPLTGGRCTLYTRPAGAPMSTPPTLIENVGYIMSPVIEQR